MRTALALVTLVAMSIAQGAPLQIRTPAGAVAPTSFEDCNRVDQRWGRIQQEISEKHTQCLRSARSEGSNGTCSNPRCQHYHDATMDLGSGNLSERRKVQRDTCLRAVEEFKDRQQAQQSQADKQQRELDELRANLERLRAPSQAVTTASSTQQAASHQQLATEYCRNTEALNDCLNKFVNVIVPALSSSKQSGGNALKTLELLGENIPKGASAAMSSFLGVGVDALRGALDPDVAQGAAQINEQRIRDADERNGGLLGGERRMRQLREASGDPDASADEVRARLESLRQSRAPRLPEPPTKDFGTLTKETAEEALAEIKQRLELYRRQKEGR